MDKQTFISQIKPTLKALGYEKSGNYWYKTTDSHICCIHIQGSQWDKHDYYVNIGFAFSPVHPTILQWHCRHRCKGASGELNILPEELLKSMENTFDTVTATAQISAFLEKHNAVKVVSQFWF